MVYFESPLYHSLTIIIIIHNYHFYRPACISPFILMYACQKTTHCAYELRSIGVATINACVCVWIWKDEEMVRLFY